MVAVGIVLHHDRPEAGELASTIATWLEGIGHEVRMPAGDAEAAGRADLAASGDGFALGLDLAVSLGGDGTMLRTVDLVGSTGVAVLGVNIGQLGYLAVVEPPGAQHAIERFLAGDCDVEERMLLEVAVERPGAAPEVHLALNEAVLEKTPNGHTVRLQVEVDGRFFTTYAADGLIVATPTGSTAYAFSARGPIVAPTHRAILLTPVSPHMLFDRSLVLEPTTRLRLVVEGERPATVSVDGRNLGELGEAAAITCTAADRHVRLVSFVPRDFLQILKTKFGLNDR
jgi:NAD+ kinase